MNRIFMVLVLALATPAQADLLFPPDMKIQEPAGGADDFLDKFLGIWHGDINNDGHKDGVAFTEIQTVLRNRLSAGTSTTVVTAILTFGHSDANQRQYLKPFALRASVHGDTEGFILVTDTRERKVDKLTIRFGPEVDRLDVEFMTARGHRAGPAQFIKAAPKN